MLWRTAPHAQDSWNIKRRFRIIQFINLSYFLRCMAKKQREGNAQEIQPQIQSQESKVIPLSNDEKELISAAVRLALAKVRKHAIMVTIHTLTKHVYMMLPLNIDVETLKQYVKEQVKHRIVVLEDRIGSDELKVEAVLLYDSIEELIEALKQKKVEISIKVIDAGLDSVEVYRK